MGMSREPQSNFKLGSWQYNVGMKLNAVRTSRIIAWEYASCYGSFTYEKFLSFIYGKKKRYRVLQRDHICCISQSMHSIVAEPVWQRTALLIGQDGNCENGMMMMTTKMTATHSCCWKTTSSFSSPFAPTSPISHLAKIGLPTTPQNLSLSYLSSPYYCFPSLSLSICSPKFPVNHCSLSHTQNFVRVWKTWIFI